jgi:importin subunit beta-1
MVDISDNITQILTNALSGDKQIRQDSEKKLEQKALGNFPEFLYELAQQLSDESKSIKIRQLAATYIKNSIVRSDNLREIWVNKIDPNSKEQIKRLVLSTLATSFKEVRAAAGIVIAGICKVDLPLQEKWPELISSLCQNSYHENINISLAAIESLGYLCEELTLKTIDTVSIDSILSALITNLSGKLNNLDIVKSCLKALFHTIRLAEKNFSREVTIYSYFLL